MREAHPLLSLPSLTLRKLLWHTRKIAARLFFDVDGQIPNRKILKKLAVRRKGYSLR